MKLQTPLALLVLYATTPATAQEPPADITQPHLVSKDRCLEDNFGKYETCERNIATYVDTYDGRPRFFGEGTYGIRDRKVASKEYRDWLFDQVCILAQTTPTEVETQAKSKDPADTVSAAMVYLTVSASFERQFLPLDVNRDCFVDTKDDVNKDDMITLEDQTAYTTLPKNQRIKPVKGYPGSCDKEVERKEKEFLRKQR